MKDKIFSANVRIYNNRLRSLRLNAGLTVAELCRLSGISPTLYGRIEKMKVCPKTNNGGWRSGAKKLAEYWRLCEEDLFPDKLMRMDGYEIEFEISPEELNALGAGLSQYSIRLHNPEDGIIRKEICERIKVGNRHLINLWRPGYE